MLGKPKDIKQAVLWYLYETKNEFKVSDIANDGHIKKHFHPNRLSILMHLKAPLGCGIINEIKRGTYRPNNELIDEFLGKLFDVFKKNYYFKGEIELSNGKMINVNISRNNKKYYIALMILRRGKPFTKKELARDLDVTKRFIEQNVTSHPLIKCINHDERIHKYWFC